MKKLDGQFIGTQFIMFILPLIPLQSFFFMDDFSQRGIKIGFFWKQVVMVYGVIFCLVGIFLCIFKIAEPSKAFFSEVPTYYASTSLILLIFVMIYFAFFLGEITDEERRLRKLYGKAAGINALPEYLSTGATNTLLNNFTVSFIQKFGMEWKEALGKDSIDPSHIPDLFVILGYSRRINKEDNFVEKWYERILKEYKTLPTFKR